MSVWIDETYLPDIGVEVLVGGAEPALPNTRDRSIIIPGRFGAYDLGAELDVRNFEINCGISGIHDHNLIAMKVREFARLFVDSYGRPKTVKLRFDSEPSRFYYVRYSGNLPVDKIAYTAKFTIPLTAYDPWCFAEMEFVDNDVVKRLGMSESFKELMNQPYADQTYTIFKSTLRKVGIYNYSDFHTPFGIVASGSFSNLIIRNETTNKEMRINGTFESGDKLHINGKNYTAYLERPSERKYFFLSSGQIIKAPSKWVEINLFANQQGDFFDLAPGANVITFESASLASSYIQYDWLHRFI